MPIVGLLLAAGSGSRFGGDKLQAVLADGRVLGLASYRHLREALEHVLVVVRAGDIVLQTLLEAEGASVVECADADLGMSRSLIAGLHAASDAQGWVVALADMPFVKPVTIRAVADALRAGATIAMPAYRGARGHPVGFASRLKEDLLGISGDQGAREVLLRHEEVVQVIECDDPGILRDIDTLGDLRN